MNSVLLECRLLHHRLRPRRHRFANRIFFFALDLAEVEILARRLWLFSHNRPNFYALHDRDFFPAREESALTQKVRGYLHDHGIRSGAGLRVVLISIPRIAGYLFNPVSFYLCHEGSRPLGAVAEVTNTFREVKRFLIPPSANGRKFTATLPKEFYVSPFTESDGEFRFSIRYEGGQLAVRIDEHESGQLMVHSVVSGRARPLTNGCLAWCAVKYPLLSLQVIARIHSQALRLYLKRIPWWRKNDQAALQKNFHRPAARRGV